jgi:hypothetical protein
MPKEIGCLFKGRITCEVVNINTIIGQFAKITVEITNIRSCGHDVFKATCCGRHKGLPPEEVHASVNATDTYSSSSHGYFHHEADHFP